MRFWTKKKKKKPNPSRKRRDLKRLHKRIANTKKKVIRLESEKKERLRIKNDIRNNNTGKSEVVPVIEIIDISDEEDFKEFETNCSEIIYDDNNEDCILLSDREIALHRRSLRILEDARVEKEAKLQEQNDREYGIFMSNMDKLQREDGNILLPRPPKVWEERARDWKDSWTFSPHVIGANELLRIAHAGRAAERQRVIDSQASFRQFQQDWRNRSIPRAA